ncbi:MAG: (2Fe-2S) ferredoxin domain-containing protein [Spirochaetes bacterium]|nr:(2Fe-2S) ferredoxin domain-containing protein [Spirochaetota bacterium]
MKKKFNSLKEFYSYQSNNTIMKSKILVGYGSCGIAAGADKVYDTFESEIIKRSLKDIELIKVGCLGLCFSEPNVEIIINGLPDILYGKVDEKFAVRIIDEHIINKNIINHNLYDKPYIDLFNNKES